MLCSNPEVLGEFYEDVEDGFGLPDDVWDDMEPDTVTLAELVESCMACLSQEVSGGAAHPGHQCAN